MKVSGIITFSIDGVQQWIEGGLTIKPGYPMRESRVLASGQTVFSEKPTESSVEGEVVNRSDFDWLKFVQLDGVTITVDTGAGKSYVFNNCTFTGDPETSTEDGKTKFKFVSTNKIKEITS